MNIYLFDFDNTIVRLPYEETIEYLDQKESLDPKLNFSVIIKTRKDYVKYSKYDPDGLFLILSNRNTVVKDSLINLLGTFGYIFEDYYLIDSNWSCNANTVVKEIV